MSPNFRFSAVATLPSKLEKKKKKRISKEKLEALGYLIINLVIVTSRYFNHKLSGSGKRKKKKNCVYLGFESFGPTLERVSMRRFADSIHNPSRCMTHFVRKSASKFLGNSVFKQKIDPTLSCGSNLHPLNRRLLLPAQSQHFARPIVSLASLVQQSCSAFSTTPQAP